MKTPHAPFFAVLCVLAFFSTAVLTGCTSGDLAGPDVAPPETQTAGKASSAESFSYSPPGTHVLGGEGDGKETAARGSSANPASAAVGTEDVSSGSARVNVPGCQNDDDETDIFLPGGDFRFGVPIISSNCVLEAGPTEHLIVHSELPEDVSAPARPVVFNYENTGAMCWANNEDENYTTDWEQRITPSGQVHLRCHFNAKKSDDS